MDSVASWFGELFESILPAFQNPVFAYQVAIVGLAIALLLIALAVARSARTQALLGKRYRVIERALGPNPSSPREAFAKNWQEIDTVMLGGPTPPRSGAGRRLRVAWEEFRETLVDIDKAEIRNTQRPHEYFEPAVRTPSWLDFSANLFVGAGLLLTFIGLVAALKEASAGVEAQDTQETQRALTHLLAVASTKFVTSIVGVGLSIILKLVDRGLAHRLNASVGRLCSQIERGLHHVSLQGLAGEQLDELRQQTKQLKSFATEVAVAIGDRFNQSLNHALAPVSGAIDKLAGSIERSQTEQMQALRDGAGRAIDGAASRELRALSEVLGSVSGALATMQSSVAASGDEAARQISAAAEKFEKVADGMRESFQDLARQMADLGASAAEQGRLQADAAKTQLSQYVENLGVAGAAQAEVLRASASELGQASGQVLASVTRATEEAAIRIGAAAASSMETAASAAGDVLGQAGDRIAASLDGVVSRAERTGETFGRIDATLSKSADSFGTMAERAATGAEAIRGAVQSITDATTTSRETTALLRTVVAQFEKGAISVQEAMDRTGLLAARIEEQQKSVNATWDAYRKHFEGIDGQLGQALQKWADQHKLALEQLNQHVVGIDNSMGSAVSKLSVVVEPLSELAEAMNERKLA